MAITEKAKKHHEELLPSHRSTLKVTAPKLIELFDNFAFEKVLRHGRRTEEGGPCRCTKNINGRIQNV